MNNIKFYLNEEGTRYITTDDMPYAITKIVAGHKKLEFCFNVNRHEFTAKLDSDTETFSLFMDGELHGECLGDCDEIVEMADFIAYHA